MSIIGGLKLGIRALKNGNICQINTVYMITLPSFTDAHHTINKTLQVPSLGATHAAWNLNCSNLVKTIRWKWAHTAEA